MFARRSLAGYSSLQRNMKLGVAALILVGLASGYASQDLLLQPALPVTGDATPLNVGAQAIPCVADWNGDGLSDLVVGFQPAFKIAVYLNSGTARQPVLTNSIILQAGGEDIYLPSPGCGSPAPWVGDYDGDGKRDLLAGSGGDGRILFYRNTNTDADPLLATGVPLLLAGATLSVGARATPYVHDWDEDGLPDLLSGDANGLVHWFRNMGTLQSPTYTNDGLIQAGGAPLNLGYRSTVRVCDWDGDGVKDLVGSGAYYAAWCRNTGTDSSPLLASPIRLQAPSSSGGLANVDNGYRMRLEVVDWNGDQLPDLLIGSWDGYIYWYESYRFLLTIRRLLSGNRYELEWTSAPFLNYSVLAGSAPGQFTSTLVTNLTSAGRQTCWTNTPTGEPCFFRLQISQ